MKNAVNKIQKNLYLVLCMLFYSLIITAQNGTIAKGVVLDENNEPVIGATISIKGNKSIGTIADIDGKFQLKVPNADAVLVISFIGMTPQEVKIGKQPIRVILKSDNVQLEEVVVVGFGKQKKESVVGAIAQTTGATLEKAGGTSNLGAALTGNLPGLVTVQSTGLPGEETPSLLVRGQTTWNGSQPLVLVDGIERPLADVDVNSVEAISVLKDASATAVFGVRGANGVILITTKRGQEGKAAISIGANVTMKTVSKLPNKYDAYDALMRRNQIAEHEVARFENAWSYINTQSFIENYRNQTTQEQRERYPNIDWQDYMFKDYAMAYDFNLNIRGGNSFLKYFVATDYSHEGDLFKEFKNDRGYTSKFNYDRLNTRTNFDFQLSKTTLFKVNLFASYGVRTFPPGAKDGDYPTTDVTRYMSSVYQIPANFYYPRYSDGTYGYQPSGGIENPQISLATRGVYKYTNTRITTDFVFEQDLKFILKGLKFQAALSWDNRFQERNRGIKDRDPGEAIAVRVKYIDPYTGQEEFLVVDQGIDQNTQFDWAEAVSWTTRGGIMHNNSTYRGLNYNAQLNYNATFARDHNVTLMGNVMRQEYSTSNNIPTYREDWVFRGTYDYAKRYFFEYNGAYNGSEKFDKNNRFGFFSSGAVGWMVSEEKFMKKLKFLDMLKLRYSYGKIGDDSINERWIYMDEWAYDGNAYLGQSGGTPQTSPYTFFRQSKLGNSGIRWETVTKHNFGVDYAILGGLIAGSIDVFKDVRDDIIIKGSDRANPDYFGQAPPTANLGKMQAKGYEIELRFNKQLNQDMRLWLNLNMTHAKNTILERDDAALLPAYQKKAGYANGQNKSYISSGFYNTIDELYGSTPFQSSDVKIPGGYYIVDYNGDGQIYSDDDNVPYAYTGTPQNTYNCSLGFYWKGLSIFLQFYGVNNVTRNVDLTGNPLISNLYDIGDYWTKENPNAGYTYPNLASTLNGAYKGDFFVYDGSYIRLKNAEISYTLDSKFIKGLGINSMRIYLNGSNLWMWSKMPDDRESGGLNVNNAYPMARRFNLGVKINL